MCINRKYAQIKSNHIIFLFFLKKKLFTKIKKNLEQRRERFRKSKATIVTRGPKKEKKKMC
jgi:hypothetical protein